MVVRVSGLSQLWQKRATHLPSGHRLTPDYITNLQSKQICHSNRHQYKQRLKQHPTPSFPILSLPKHTHIPKVQTKRHTEKGHREVKHLSWVSSRVPTQVSTCCEQVSVWSPPSPRAQRSGSKSGADEELSLTCTLAGQINGRGLIERHKRVQYMSKDERKPVH